MPRPVSQADLISRLHDYPKDNYLFIGSVIKGVAVGFAGLVLLQIVSSPLSEWIKLGPWIASVVVILVSYMTWGRGVILTNARANVWDTVFPLSMGIVEIFLFAMLLDNKDHPDVQSQLVIDWLAVVGIHTLLAVGLVLNRLRLTDVDKDFTSNLKSLATQYRHWMWGDVIGASVVALVAVCSCLYEHWRIYKQCPSSFWVLQGISTLPKSFWKVHSLTALGFAGVLWGVVLKANKERNAIDKYVTEKGLASDTVENQQV